MSVSVIGGSGFQQSASSTRGSGMVLVSALLLSIAGIHDAASAERTLTLGIAGFYEGHLPLELANREGYFREAGIKVDYLLFRGGSPAVQAFVGGSVDFCICAGDHVVRLNYKGFDARVLSGLDEYHGSVLLALAASGITDVASLRGKRVGMTAPGSYSDNTLRWALRKSGIDPQRDVEILGIGDGSAMRAALETHQIDAGTVNTIDAVQLDTTKFQTVDDWRGINYAALLVIGRQTWVDANKDIARRFVAALARAQRQIQSDPESTIPTIKAMYPAFGDEMAHDFAASAVRRLSKDGSVSESAWRGMLAILKSSDPDVSQIELGKVDLHATLLRSTR
jgi:NitT/TauT family transport system substrate-binding protein